MAKRQLNLAREIRRQVEDAGGLPAAAIAEIRQRCGVSLLRAHRLYHGLSASDVAVKLGADRTRIGRWETGQDRPGHGYVDGLCRLYRTGPVQLGLFTDYGTDGRDGEQRQSPGAGISLAEAGEPDVEDDEAMKRRDLLAGLVAAPAVQALEVVRRQAQRTLAATTVTTGSVDEWEQAAEEYGTRVLTTPPVPFLKDLGADFTEIAAHIHHRQPTHVQQDLTHAAARFAGLIAMTFCNLEETRLARRWWTTAQSLADESGDATVRAWVLGEMAVHGLYQGSPLSAVVKPARQAQHLTSNPKAETARALAAEAQALARIGRKNEAVRIVRQRLEPLFSKLPKQITTDHSIYGWPEFRQHFVLSYVYTFTGKTALARQAQSAALPLYPQGHYGSSANIRLHQAAVLIAEGDAGEGARHASDIVLGLPRERRVNSVLATAELVLEAVPDRAGDLPAVVELRDLLASERVTTTAAD